MQLSYFRMWTSRLQMGLGSQLLRLEAVLLILGTKERQRSDLLVLFHRVEEGDVRLAPTSCDKVSKPCENTGSWSSHIRVVSPEKHFSNGGKYSCPIGAIFLVVNSCPADDRVLHSKSYRPPCSVCIATADAVSPRRACIF